VIATVIHQETQLVNCLVFGGRVTIKFAKFLRLLLEQMRYFPKGKYDDGLDALEMAVQVAEEKPKTITVTIVGGDRDDWYGDYHRNLGWPKIF